jgi:hypothetical protein
MNTSRQKLKAMGPGRLPAAVRDRSLPSLRLTAGKPSAQPVTRRWPLWQELPLSFIAQLDLATLPPVRGLPLPKTGSLFFFYDAESQPWGFDPKDKDCAQVIYSASPLAGNRPRAWHRDLDEEVRFKGFSLTAIPELSRKLTDPLSTRAHRIGGHADEIQGAVDLCS